MGGKASESPSYLARFPHRTTFLVKKNVGQKLNKTDGNFWQAVVGGWLLFLFFNRSSFHPKLAAHKI